MTRAPWTADELARHVAARLATPPTRALTLHLAAETDFATATRQVTAAVLRDHHDLPHHASSPRRTLRWDDHGTIERIETFPFGGSVIEGYRAVYALVLPDGTAVSFSSADDTLPVAHLDLELRAATAHALEAVERALRPLTR